MEAAQWIALGAFLVAAGGLLFGVGKHIYGRIAEVDKHRSDDVNELHRKVDGVKDTYVRRDDLQQHLSRIEETQRQTTNALTTLSHEVKSLAISVTKALVGRRGDGSDET